MQYHNTLEAIHANLEEALDIIQRMGTSDSMYQIDMDLSLEKIRQVYDLMLTLKKEGLSVPEQVKQVKDDKHVKKNVDSEVVKQKILEKTNDIEFETSTTQKTETKVEVKAIEKEEKASENQTEKKILSDTLNTEKTILNDELSQNNAQEDVISKLNTKPISDLTSGLGLNDKFELINNLFEGDNLLFEKTMSTLNMATDFNEAYNYLNENFQWDMKSPSVQKVLELIRRKLITG